MNWQRIRTRCGRKLFLLTLAVVGSTTAAPAVWSEDSDSVFESVVVEPIGGPLWRPESRGIAAAGPLQRLAMLQEEDDAIGAIGQTAPPDAPTAGNPDSSPIEQYGEAPVDRTPQFLRSVTPLLARGQMQCDCGLTYSIQEQDFPVIVGANIVRADARRRSIFVPLAIRYGLNERTQLFVNAPLGWSNTEFATPLFDDDRSSTGIGDVSFGATVLLRQNTCTGRSLVGTLRATAPTGDAINPLVVTTAGTGNGVWRLGGDLLVIKNLDPVILFYGAGYTYSFEEEFSGLDVQLGHQISYNLGLGFAANERVTLSTAFLGSYVTETEVDDLSLPNTDQDIMQLRLAATISQCNRLIEPFVAFGLTERSPSAQVGIVCTR